MEANLLEPRNPINQPTTEGESLKVLSVVIPELLQREFKASASLKGQTIQEAVRTAFRAYIDNLAA